jgi:glycosyltransferase involved in cell wall biosynthesis
MNALACGTKIIASRGHGHLDYLNEENCQFIEVEAKTDIEDNSNTYYRQHPEIASRIVQYMPKDIDISIKKALQRSWNQKEESQKMLRRFSKEYTTSIILEKISEKTNLPQRKPMTKSPMRTAICIPIYNYKEHIFPLISKIDNLNHPNFIIFVYDDGSDDGTEYFFSGKYSWRNVEYFKCSENKGNALAVQESMKMGLDWEPYWLMMLDGDMIIDDMNFLNKLCDAYVDGVLSPKMILPDGKVWWCGARYFKDFEQKDFMVRHENKAKVIQTTEHNPFACWLTTADIARKVKVDLGYPKNLWTDADIDLQLISQGFNLWVEPGITLIHNQYDHRRFSTERELDTRSEWLIEGKNRFNSKWKNEIENNIYFNVARKLKGL